MNKRGEGEEFNWIFVIVAGSIILAFFILFTFKYIDLQQKKQDVDTVRFFGSKVIAVSSRLEVGSGGAAVDSNDQEGLRFGYTVDLGYKCAGNQSTILINKGVNAWYNLQDEIVFMDNDMKVSALDLWVLPWSYPFFVSNFIYLGDPRTTFYLVEDGTSKEFVDNLDITSAFKIQKVMKNQFTVKPYSKVVFFTNSIPRQQDILALRKNTTNVNFVYINLGKREVNFYNLDDNTWSDAIPFYITKDNYAQLFGAIFSNDADNYDCNIRRSLNRVKVVSTVYSKRAELLSQLDRRPDCHYNEISRSLSLYTGSDPALAEVINNENLAGAGCIWVF